MRISPPNRTYDDGEVSYRVDVQSQHMPDALWYSIDEQYEDLISSRSDAPLVALLIRAMEEDEDIYVAGTVSERLYYNLSRPYQAVLQTIHPALKRIDIYPETVKPALEQAAGVATGFSAGIDSFSVLADHHYSKEVPTGFRCTHLLFNNVGSHGTGGEQLFRERYARIRGVTEQIGLPFIAVNSNLDDFYEGWKFHSIHTPLNASVALLLQKKIGRFLYGSSYSYADVSLGENRTMAHGDPVALPLLSTTGLDAIAVGSAYTRPEKTVQVADIEDSHQTLDVCTRPDAAGNCSTCRKCRRTLLTLEIAGLLDRYEEVFDLEAYYQGRAQHIAYILQSDRVFAREIKSFARDRGFTFSPPAQWKATVQTMKRTLREIVPQGLLKNRLFQLGR